MVGAWLYLLETYLPSSDSDVLMQGAFSLESTHGARTGYVVLNFTRENFDNLLNGFYSSGDTLLVLDSHQKPLYCSRPEYGEREISDIIGHTISGQGGTEKKGVYTKYLWTREPSQGFYILLRCSAPISAPAVRTMGTVSLALSGLGLVLCLLIAGALSRSIGQPVSLLDKAMAKVKKGDLSIRIRTNRQDELGRLTESFNQMTGDLQKYLDDTVQKQKDLNKTTLRLYQTQLNPHFLYNTLDSVNMLARKNGDRKVAELVTDLSRLFRLGLNQGRDMVTVRDELMHVIYYLKIQKVRFDDQLIWEMETEPDILDYEITKFILQPIVENAIYHGVKSKESSGYLKVSAGEDGEFLIFTVEDTGNGMDPESLAKLQKRINSEQTARCDERGFGMWNVNQRIKLCYGETCGIEVESEENRGMKVTLRVLKY